MDTQTALYFPYIRVPQTPWFTQVLLYWDRAATIVPSPLWRDEDEIDPFMRDLRDAGLLSLLSPDEGLYGLKNYEAFGDGFLQLLDRQIDPMEPRQFVRLHVRKMGMMIFHQLKDKGLARRPRERGAWYEVEHRTADLYMAYLASVMSASHPGTFPVTDSPGALGTLNLHGVRDERSTAQRLAALRYSVIEQALPAPQGPVSVEELRRFKDDNTEALRRCRTYLDGKLADLAALDDPDLRQVKQVALLQEIEDDVARLQEQMTERRWPKISLVGFGGVVGAALSMADQLADADNPLAMGLAVGTGLLSLAPPMYDLFEMVDQPQMDPRAPLAYAVLAGRL